MMMLDREKVIKGLEICAEKGAWHGLDCSSNKAYKGCPYYLCETGCVVTIARDAIELLKEQEEEIENLKQTCQSMMEGAYLLKEQAAVKPIITPWAEDDDGNIVVAKKECGKCGYQFFTERPNFCENCGTPILWEGR